MNNFKKIIQFYLKPFIVIQLLILLLYIVVGSYFEDYEGFFSTAIEGTFTKPALIGWDTDTHFLLLYIYSWLANFTLDSNLYGFILSFNNWLSLTFLGLVIYRILIVNLSKDSIVIFVVLCSIIYVDNILNLNCVRHAFVFIASILAYIESKRFENKPMSKFQWLLLSIIIVYASLIRFEAVLLFSIIYLVLLFIHNRFYKLALVPVFISGLLFVAFNFSSAHFSSKEKKVLIYKEREIFDRYNIDYEKLSPIQKLDVDAIMQYCITDKEHFTLSFYDSISRNKTANGALEIFNGFNYNSFLTSWRISTSSFYKARFFFLFYFLSGFFIFWRYSESKKRFFLQYVFLGFFPFLLCFYTVVPLRFIIPFLALSGFINIFIFIKNSANANNIRWFCLIILLFIIYDSTKTKELYNEKAKHYNDFAKSLLLLDQKQNSINPIVINSVFPVNYFPVKPFDKLYKQHAVFLNFYLFSADDYQIRTWKELCDCNTFSLKERVDYMVSHQNLFLIDNNAFEFMKNYFLLKYHIKLQQTIIGDFDENLKICKLHYLE